MLVQRTRQEPKFKQMAFETAVRNPERYIDILSAVKNYEGIVLNEKNLLDIVAGLYVTQQVSSEEIIISDGTKVEDIKDAVIEVNLSRNADGGFPKGYPSRFWTYMRTLAELGFVYAKFNEPFEISKIGHKLIKNEIDEQEAFSIQAVKFNRRSPYRNVSNDYNFFRLTIELLLDLRNRGHKLSYEQFIVLMFNKSGDISETIKILNENNFADEDQVYDFVSRFYGNTNKKATVLKDYPDVVRRIMVISGFITIRYSGKKFIELNESKLAYIQELFDIEFDLNEEEKNNARKYFDKLNSSTDTFIALVEKYRVTDTVDGNKYTERLIEIIRLYDLNESKIIESIQKIESGSDVIPEFKEIPAPLKLEFYISILVALKYKGIFLVKPNYKADHIGKPYSHAPGNNGDINVYSDDTYWLIEVTLIRNKTQQLNNETTTLVRHLNSEEVFKNYTKKYLSLVAPVIHDDTKSYLDVALVQNQVSGKKIHIKPYDIKDFVSITKEGRNLTDMEEYTTKVFERFSAEVLKSKSI